MMECGGCGGRDGVGGRGSGREIPESGRTRERDGEDDMPVSAELVMTLSRALEDSANGDAAMFGELDSWEVKRVLFD